MTPPEPNLLPASPRKYRAGDAVHHWTLLSFWRGPQYPKIMVLAECDCGSPPRLVQLQNIANGASTNCGCLRKKALSRHGLSHHPLYRVWLNMIARCTDPTHPAYERYGKRGVSVCDRWLSLGSFIADMENGNCRASR